MRRIAINRGRTFGIAAVVVGVLWVVVALALVVIGGNLFIHLAQLAFGVGFLVIGVRRLITARKELRKFEEENGSGAGAQNPVR